MWSGFYYTLAGHDRIGSYGMDPVANHALTPTGGRYQCPTERNASAMLVEQKGSENAGEFLSSQQKLHAGDGLARQITPAWPRDNIRPQMKFGGIIKASFVRHVQISAKDVPDHLEDGVLPVVSLNLLDSQRQCRMGVNIFLTLRFLKRGHSGIMV